MITPEQRADKAGWIHDQYVRAFDAHVPAGPVSTLSKEQAEMIKRRFKEINKEADKIFGK